MFMFLLRVCLLTSESFLEQYQSQTSLSLINKQRLFILFSIFLATSDFLAFGPLPLAAEQQAGQAGGRPVFPTRLAFILPLTTVVEVAAAVWLCTNGSIFQVERAILQCVGAALVPRHIVAPWRRIGSTAGLVCQRSFRKGQP